MSPAAKACPHCGHPTSRQRGREALSAVWSLVVWLAWGVTALAILAMLGLFVL